MDAGPAVMAPTLTVFSFVFDVVVSSNQTSTLVQDHVVTS